MGKSPSKVIIQQQPNGQTIVTIPKPIVDALGLQKGQSAEWKLGRDRKLELLIQKADLE